MMRPTFFAQTSLRYACFFAALGLLAGCATFSGEKPEPRPGHDTATPGYKVGAPYQISGVWYYPNENYSYDETGIASWYGPGFHQKKTANGEIFDSEELTAAHPTLPMPSLARVTNLDNGRSVVVRINDRGPFAHSRLIDVSRKAADLLGFLGKGTAKVRVQVLADESRAIAQAARQYGAAQAEQAYSNATYSTASVTPVRATTITSHYVPPKTPLPQHIAHNIGETGMELPQVTQVAVQANPQIFVQAGAFTIRANADKLKAQIAKLGPTRIDQDAVNGIVFYRVRIGPISNVAKADALLAKVSGAGVPSPRIIIH